MSHWMPSVCLWWEKGIAGGEKSRKQRRAHIFLSPVVMTVNALQLLGPHTLVPEKNA